MTDERLAATRTFSYDSINRLAASTGGPTGSISYTLDGVGNREEVTGGSHAGEYTMSPSTPSPADLQMNQYTMAPFGGLPSVSRTYDLNGNATLIPFQEDGETTPVTATATYDYRNLMVKYQRTGMTADYKYDALGRRIETTLTDGEDTTTTLFLHRGDQEIEERDGEEAVLATYVHGNGIDELLSMRRGAEDYYYHADDQGTVWAITASEGAVVERYDYEDYGETYVLDPSEDPLAESSIGNPACYTGRRFDPESGLNWYRTRYYVPAEGRFSSKDSISLWGDTGALGNGSIYARNNPWTLEDPMGTCAPEREKRDCDKEHRDCLIIAENHRNKQLDNAADDFMMMSNYYSSAISSCFRRANSLGSPVSRVLGILGCFGASVVVGELELGAAAALSARYNAAQAVYAYERLNCFAKKLDCRDWNGEPNFPWQ